MKALIHVTAGIAALAAAAVVFAHPDSESGPHAHHAAFKHHEFSAEHVAMHNLVVAALATKTGRSQDDITKMFQNSAPPDVAKQLGLDEDAMHAIMANAHRTLIERMQAARLITPDQAEKLKAAPLPGHPHGAEDHGTREVQ